MTNCGILVGLVTGLLLAYAGGVAAQTATIVGSVGNFDVAKNQQQDAHGFEIEPTAGAFQSWTDACTGTGPTCAFTITKDSKVQATFNK
jgi:hypothetical protein